MNLVSLIPPEAGDPAQLWARYSPILINGAMNVILATVTLIVGLWVAAWAGDAMRRLAAQHPRIDDTLAAFFAWMVRSALTVFAVVAVLNRFGVATTSIVAVIGASALAIGLALQGTLSNVAAGVMLILFRPYRLGDYVEIATRLGTVEDINLFTTELTTPQNQRIVIPNAQAWGAPMVNFTAHPRRRIDLEFGVAYDTDLTKAMSVLNEAMRATQGVLEDPKPWVEVRMLGDFSITLAAFSWCKTREFQATKSAVMKACKEALDANAIEIPFPTQVQVEADPAKNARTKT